MPRMIRSWSWKNLWCLRWTRASASMSATSTLFDRTKPAQVVSESRAERVVLYVHGATYPSETAFDLKLNGLSWMEHIAGNGYDVYLLDLRGYGRSTRPKEMS